VLTFWKKSDQKKKKKKKLLIKNFLKKNSKLNLNKQKIDYMIGKKKYLI
jgi:hypothetical protein